MKLESPLRDLRPAPPHPSLRSRVLVAVAERKERGLPRATPVTGASGGWILLLLALLFAHAWITSASERAAAELLLNLGVPVPSANPPLGISLSNGIE